MKYKEKLKAAIVGVSNIIKVVVVEKSVVNVICDELYLETVHAHVLRCQIPNWKIFPTQKIFIFLAVIRQSKLDGTAKYPT